jgi:acetylglutamate kinase
MMSKKTIAIKIGGAAAAQENVLTLLFKEIAQLTAGNHVILVHGGGAEVSKITRMFDIEPVFKDGVRMTSAEEMEIVDMVLAGKMNKYLTRKAASAGLRSVGISGSDGSIFTGESIDPGQSKTGRVAAVNTGLLDLLLQNEYFPIIASTSMDKYGDALNINADEAALHLASSLKAEQLIFLSDIPGILKDDKIIENLTEDDAEKEIQRQTITGGMIPKVRSSLAALKDGVKNIIIGEFCVENDLSRLLKGQKGTRIYLRNSTDQED